MKYSANAYMPFSATVAHTSDLAEGVRLFTLETSKRLAHVPGQFLMVSLIGVGEVPISIASAADEPLMLCIRKAGHVTSALHGLVPGDTVGLRGPYGRGFAFEAARGRDVIVLTGGLGIAPLRPVIRELLDNRGDYGRLYLICGAKCPEELLFREESRDWEASGMRIIRTVDCAEGDWSGCVGVATSQLDAVEADFPEAAAYLCGPPVMIGIAMEDLSSRGMPPERIYTTLEAHMKCGVGKCGHCYMGPKYICTDGPVFSKSEIDGAQPL